MRSVIRFAVIGLVGSLAFAGSKISSDMPHATASGMVDVIVQYKSFAGARSAEAGRFGRIQRSVPQHPGNSHDRAGFDD